MVKEEYYINHGHVTNKVLAVKMGIITLQQPATWYIICNMLKFYCLIYVTRVTYFYIWIINKDLSTILFTTTMW